MHTAVLLTRARQLLRLLTGAAGAAAVVPPVLLPEGRNRTLRSQPPGPCIDAESQGEEGMGKGE